MLYSKGKSEPLKQTFEQPKERSEDNELDGRELKTISLQCRHKKSKIRVFVKNSNWLWGIRFND